MQELGEEKMNIGGRPPTEVSELRFKEAVKLFYMGFTGTVALGKKLGISRTSATALKVKIIKYIMEIDRVDDNIELNKTLAVKRAEAVLSRAWTDYLGTFQTTEGYGKNQALNTVLSATKYLSELTGAYRKGSINFFQQNNNLSIEQKIVMNVLDLRENDFDKKNYDKTLVKLVDYYEKKMSNSKIVKQPFSKF